MAGQFWRAGLLGPSIEQLEPRLLLDGLGLVQSLAEGSSYYVNLAIDADFGDNEYTTAAGNDANDGLTSATPKASVQALLNQYPMGPGDTVFVDTGEYLLSNGLTVTSDDGGVRIVGAAAHSTVLKGPGTGTVVNMPLSFTSSGPVTLQHLTIRDGFTGVSAAQPSIVLDHVTVLNCGLYAVYRDFGLPGSSLVLTDCDLSGGSYALYASGPGVSLTRVLAHDSGTGISINSSGATLTDCQAWNNVNDGIRISGSSAVVTSCTAWDNLGTGIEIANEAALVTGCTVWNNDVGLSIDPSYVSAYTMQGLVEGNTSHDNRVGISVRAADVRGNVVYANSQGVVADKGDSIAIERNRIYDNVLEAIYVGAADQWSQVSAEVSRNTIRQTTGDGVRIGDGAAALRDNILSVANGAAIVLDPGAQIDSDYNIFWTPTPSLVVRWQGEVFTDLGDWSAETGNDAHSLQADPLFADGDFHLAAESPAIDRADPAGPYVFEPTPNGCRANIGAYGNTPDAAVSSVTPLVQVIAPGHNEKFRVGDEVEVLWRSAGLTAERPVGLVNVGGPGYWGWQANPQTYTGITVTEPLAAVDTSGTARPAPEEIYKTCAEADSGVGAKLTRSLEIPDGTYTVTLHFADPGYFGSGDRVFDVYLEDVLLCDDFDPVAAAGDTRTAFTLTYVVAVSDGDGLLVELVNQIGKAILSGIEVTAADPAGLADPRVDLELSIDGGATWGPLASGLAMDRHGWGRYVWTADTAADAVILRATALDGSQPAGVSDWPIPIAAGGANFYVNVRGDSDLSDNEYTTAGGDNTNSGLAPDAPMASLAALLRAYELRPGDTIHVDTGTYRLASDVVIGSESDGITVMGASQPGHVTVLDRANPSAGTVLRIGDASDLAVRYLTLTGGQTGISAEGSDADRVEISNCIIHDIPGRAIYAGASCSEWVLSQCEIYACGADLAIASGTAIVHLDGHDTHVIGNSLHNNSSAGIYCSGDRTVIEQNELTEGDGAWGLGAWGDNAVVRSNIVRGYMRGVSVGGAEIAPVICEDNLVQNSTIVGIDTGAATVRGNRVVGSEVGIRVFAEGGVVENNVVYANVSVGIVVDGAEASTNVVNNTIYQAAGQGIRLQNAAKDVFLRNNILWTVDGPAISVSADSAVGFDSDYNLFYHTGSGALAEYAGHGFSDQTEWFYAMLQDSHSREGDPLFVDPDGADGIFGGPAPDDDFHLMPGSPGIDAGDPSSYFLAEPAPNGGAANLGAYGNTPEAATSIAQAVRVTAPDGLARYEAGQAITIEWQTFGLGTLCRQATINAGGDIVGEWGYDRYRVTGISASTTDTATIDTSGVSEPPPAEVYQTWGQSDFVVGGELAYHLPVAAGQYTLRLHMVERDGSVDQWRDFDIYVQDLKVADNFNIALEAGGLNKAICMEYPVTAADDGLDVRLVNRNSWQAMVMGIEVVEVPSEAENPTAGVEVSTDGGANWETAGSGVASDAYGRGSLVWVPGTPTVGFQGLVRVTVDGGSGLMDVSDRHFMVFNDGTEFYVSSSGQNGNSGKSPDQPMASLETLLDVYDLDYGDTIHVESGTYVPIRPVTVGLDDAGVTIRGPAGATAYLDATGLEAGLYVYGTAEVTLRDLEVTGGQYGVYVKAVDAVLRGLRVHGAVDGIYLAGDGGLAEACEAYGNANNGIIAEGDVLVRNCTAHDNGGRGLDLVKGCRAEFNEAYDNAYGIAVGPKSGGGLPPKPGGIPITGGPATAERNRVYRNGTAGILATNVAIAIGNRVFSNEVGILAKDYFTGLLSSNVVYANTIAGVDLSYARANSGSYPRVLNNTIYQPSGAGIRISSLSRDVVFSSNIVWVESGFGIDVESGGTTGFVSDYNRFHTTGTAKVGQYVSTNCVDLAAWQTASGKDAHSTQGDPGLVDVDGLDDMLGFSTTPVGPVSIVDDGDAGFSTVGSATQLTFTGFQGDVTLLLGDPTGVPTAVATWSAGGLTPGALYMVAATWPSTGTQVTYTVGDGVLQSPRQFAQAEMPAGFTADGATWAELAILRPAGDTITVTAESSFFYADAVRIQPILGDRSVDDNFDLLGDSPCFNAADPARDYSGMTDLHGRQRVIYGAPDIGADEYELPGDVTLDGTVDTADYITLKRGIGTVDGAAWGGGDLDGDGDVDWYDLQGMRENFGLSFEAAPAASAAKADAVAEPELLAAPVADAPGADVLAIAASVLLDNRLAAGRQDVPLVAAWPANSLPPVHVAGRVGLLSIPTSWTSPLLSHEEAGQVVADVLQLAGPWWPDDSAARELPDEPLMSRLTVGITGKPRKGRLDPMGLDVLAAR